MKKINKKSKKQKNMDRNGLMPPVLTIGVFIILISFIVIAKQAIYHSDEQVTVQARSYHYTEFTDSNLNLVEQDVLTLLKDAIKPAARNGQNITQSSILYRTLEEYLSSEGVSLADENGARAGKLILSIQKILTDENQSDYTKLSLDGRKVVFFLLEQLFEICGLKLSDNREGIIEKVTDEPGNVLYANRMGEHQTFIQVDVLVIVMICMFILFIVCLLIAKKNQLFSKDEMHDGFDEKKFA